MDDFDLSIRRECSTCPVSQKDPVWKSQMLSSKHSTSRAAGGSVCTCGVPPAHPDEKEVGRETWCGEQPETEPWGESEVESQAQ